VSFDRAKALQSAQKYLAKGQLDRAITEYERLVQADPKDARLLLKLGDIYTRQGATKDAASTYRKVAEQYAEQGFFLKAVAVYKQILKLDPSQTDVWERLAEMYEMLSLVSDAIATYEQVADAYTRTSSPRKALRALQKCADLDPENVAARIRYAEALSKLNKPDEAAEAFRSGADLLKAQGRVDDYLKVAERLLFHQPDNYEFARELAATYLERSDAKHALAKLQPCFNADPKSLDTLMLLARAFEQLGQTPKTVSVLKEVARLHANDARHAEQGSVLRRILALDPNDSEARRDLSEIKRLPSEQSSSAIEVGDEDYDLLLEDDESNLVEESPVSTAPEELDDTAVAKVNRLLEECAVFIRYGLTEKMITQLQEVLSIDPRHVEAREKLKDAFLKAKRPADAIAQLIALSELVAKKDRDRAEEYLTEAIRIDPKNERAKRHLGLLNQAEGKAEDDDEVVMVDDSVSEPPPPAAARGRRRVPSDRPEESFASVMPGAEDDTMELADGDDIEMIVEEGSVVAPLEDESVMVVDEESAAEPEPEPEPVSQRLGTAPLSDRPRPHSARPTAISDRPGVPVPEALREALEEIDFYLKQGMADEAQDTLSDALESYPDHPLLLAKQRSLAGEPPLSEIPPAQTKPPSVPPPRAAPIPRELQRQPREDRSFELAQKLAEEVAPPSNSSSHAVEVADVLAQFKQGVARQVDKSDAATHYDLGIAYMEMGLHAEAIDEFKLCLSDPTRRCTAHTMIALSFVAKGDMELGIDHFKHALEENPKPEEELGLWFEMGNAYELLRKNIDALVWYEKVEERDPHFRDVIQRIERLGTARTPEQESDEFEEMFDNMILKE
jgi:tetratricopeptide (TPR) repeat protein